MKTYLTLLALLLCTPFHCFSQAKPDYAAAKKWAEDWVGGTNQTPEAERIFVVSHSPEYAVIVRYRKGITLREIIDQTRFRSATLVVAVERSIESEGTVFRRVAPSDSPAFEVKRGDIIWLVDISPPLRIASCLTPRWSQRRLPLEFMDGLSYTTIIELAKPLAGRRGSALDR